MEVTVKNLSFGYDQNNEVLKNLNFHLDSGDSLAVVGISGSGKTTLIKLLSGILPQSKKNSFLGLINLDNQAPLYSYEAGELGLMFQEISLFPNLSVKDNILLPSRIIYKKIDKEKYNYINDLIEIVGLSRHKEKLPSQLSGGMKTRTALAQVFSTQPKVLLLDESFTFLDISWRLELYQLLEKLKDNYHSTTIFVTHDIQEALLLSNKIIVLSKKGTIIQEVNIPNERPKIFNHEYVNNYLNKTKDFFFNIQKTILLDKQNMQ